MDPFFHTGLSISDSLKTVRKSVLIYETIIGIWISGSRYIRYCNRVLLFLENSNWYNDDNFEYSNYFNLLQVVGKTIFFKINKDNVNF